jgi:hypothetical protein
MERKSFLLVALIVTALVVFIILTTRTGAREFYSPEDLTPTAVPPGLLTQIAQNDANQAATQTAYPPLATQSAQTEQAFQLTLAAAPTDDAQQAYPNFANAVPSAEELLSGRADYPLAGHGILYEGEVSGDASQKYIFNGRAWYESTGETLIAVRGGRALDPPSQGAVRVIIAPHYSSSPRQNDLVIESPVQAGELTITGAFGERLILTSEQGQTFYFDVPSLRFVDSMEEIVATATPLPTEVIEPPIAPADDAIDIPLYLSAFQLEDSDVDRYINSPTDYDWFAFVSQAEGRLKVSLVPRENNYGLRVVLVDRDGNGTIVGEDTSSGGGTKQVTVDDAPSGNYIVRVWSLDGSFDEGQSYTLRFEPPKPEKVVPILECVAENPDGTFTAHFGYENPNPYVIVIDSRHQNTMHPGPVFRIGQPEYFAPGRVEDIFIVLFDGNGLTWTLDGNAVTVNRNSPRCP